MAVATLGMSLPELKATFALSETQAGGLFSIVFVVAVAASAVAGGLSDKLGRKATLLIGVGSLSLAFTTAGQAQNYAQLVVLLAIGGLGYGFTIPSVLALMSDLLPGRRGLGTGLLSVFYGLGSFSGSIISSALIPVGGWRFAFFAVAAFGWAVALAEALGVRAHAGKAGPAHSAQVGKVLNRNLILLALAEFFGGSVFFSTASWTPTVLRSAKDLTLTEAGWVMGLWGITPMIGSLALGILSDRFGRKSVILWTAFPAALTGILVYKILNSAIPLALGLMAFGILKSSAPTLVVALAQDSASVETVGAASGMVMSMHYVGAAIAPLIAAHLIAGTGDLILTMVLISSVPLVAFGSLIAAVKEDRR
jgi:MFS family permease